MALARTGRKLIFLFESVIKPNLNMNNTVRSLVKALILFLILQMSLFLFSFFIFFRDQETNFKIVSSLMIPLPVSFIFSLVLFFYLTYEDLT